MVKDGSRCLLVIVGEVTMRGEKCVTPWSIRILKKDVEQLKLMGLKLHDGILEFKGYGILK